MALSTWLITGGSAGIGLSLALAAQRAGHSVIATARNLTKASKTSPEFEELGGKWVHLDVTDLETEKKVREIVKRHDVDVVVNNAGYAMLGALEDTSDQEIFNQMDTNFFGAMRVLKGAAPFMRERRSGTIVNISSGAAFLGLPSRSIYAATKSALESVSESLARELNPFNVRVIIVDLGAFRTNFANAAVTPESQKNIGGVSEPYKGTEVEKVLQLTGTLSQVGPGNPEEAAKRIVEAVTKTGLVGSNNHARLILGSDCLARAKQVIKMLQENVDAMEEIAASTDYK